MKVAILMGSPRDGDKMAGASEMLERFVPLSGGVSGGMDAFLSTVQMPRGIPVATVAVDGSANAAVLAIEILSLNNPDLIERLKTFRDEGAR